MKISIAILFVAAFAFSSWWMYTRLNPNMKVLTEIVGVELAVAQATFFERPADEEGVINAFSLDLLEIDSHLSTLKDDLLDSIVQVYIWNDPKYTTRVWVGKTERSNSEIVDAIQYTDRIQF